MDRDDLVYPPSIESRREFLGCKWHYAYPEKKYTYKNEKRQSY